MVQNAQEALGAGRLLKPANNCALSWALQAQQSNAPGAAEVLQRTMAAIVERIQARTAAKRYEEALALVDELSQFYPGNPAMQQTIQQIRDTLRKAYAADTVRIQVIHRHGVNYRTARCEGWLTIEPNGTVAYQCDPRFPHDARCDRVSFPRGSFSYNAGPENDQLHLGTAMGSYDFFASPAIIATALRALEVYEAANRNARPQG
jgi:hypothetical protein